MATTQNLSNFIINNIDSKETFEYMKNNNLISENELYLVQGGAEDYLPEGGTAGQVLTWSSKDGGGEEAAWATPAKCYHIGTTAPTNTNLLWIDTSAGLKYHNGTEWVIVPVAWS